MNSIIKKLEDVFQLERLGGDRDDQTSIGSRIGLVFHEDSGTTEKGFCRRGVEGISLFDENYKRGTMGLTTDITPCLVFQFFTSGDHNFACSNGKRIDD